MAYTPQTWADSPATTTPIDAARLTTIEDGIAAAYSTQGPLASRPTASASNQGTFYFATDTLALYGSTGTTWTLIRSVVQTTSITAAYTVVAADDVILANAASAAFTVTAPSATALDGRRLVFKKTDSSPNAITIVTAGGTIDGATSILLTAQNQAVKLVSDGANWWEVSEKNTLGEAFNTRKYGATGAAVQLYDGTMTSGSAILTSASASFQATDVGKVIAVANATQNATLSAALASGTAYTSLAVTALTAQISSGSSVLVGFGSTSQVFTASATAAVGATAISVTSLVANANYAIGTAVNAFALTTTIASWQSSTQVTLAAACQLAVSAQEFQYGVDDTNAIVATITACLAAGGGTVFFPSGKYLCNLAQTPSQTTSYIKLVGEGEGCTTLIATNFVNATLGIRMPGEVTDMTIDGGATAVSGLSMATVSGVPISKFAVRRVTLQNVAPSKGGWLGVWWDQSSGYIIDRLDLEDVTFNGPSAQNQDAIGVSYVNRCYANNLRFNGVYRSPNFFAANRLIADDIDVVVPATGGVAALVIDKYVAEATVSRINITNGTAALHFLVNAQRFVASELNLDNSGNSFISLGSDNTSQTAMIANSYLGSGIHLNNPNASLSIDNSEVISPASSACILNLGSSSGPIYSSNVNYVGAGAGSAIFGGITAGKTFQVTASGGSISNFGAVIANATFVAGTSFDNVSGFDPIATVSAAYTMSATDQVVLANAATAAFTVTIPTAVGIAGTKISIKKTDSTANSVTITAPTSGGTIDGNATISLNVQNQSVTLLSDGTNWWEVATQTVSPATTVVGPDAFGSASTVGVSPEFARADHDHGLPAAPTTTNVTYQNVAATATVAVAAATLTTALAISLTAGIWVIWGKALLLNGTTTATTFDVQLTDGTALSADSFDLVASGYNTGSAMLVSNLTATTTISLKVQCPEAATVEYESVETLTGQATQIIAMRMS